MPMLLSRGLLPSDRFLELIKEKKQFISHLILWIGDPQRESVRDAKSETAI
jgi:hypothetical protein